ncbi:MAG: multidrug efflux MFS transporter [Lactobacillus sp.]|uniref:MFS transporter n=1 Tax=Bombilactobacillus bombi TaxID=1303590 RepID=A0A347SPR9_9LACO|nr:MDR family MFS transporter [Bombilactobacillus bombi]MCO6540950.1 multidrug efflux MFS transporter [Lactobacillus sp.]AXX64028.1 DHA2 family efflux MFS transporter permease subunit [Bombilactobacillus bombi]MCO6542602.1 multidrug efflux MFS transporter [Lactobacillus sp.]RHW47789.1 MFS transporter [Bombilactobacillus bombi]RHW51967.1 MFS transporter [Bombilactobacillus bombi]
MSKAVDINGKSFNKIAMVITLLAGTFCTVLNGTILATAFPTLMKAFDISASTVQWLTTGFMMVNGVMIPISAWISTRVNSKVLYISAMSIFLIGTIICYFANSFGMLLSGRLIQGVAVGVTMPLMQTIMLTIFPPQKRGMAMGLGGLVIGLAPAIGPTLSGWVIDNWTWRDLFSIIIPIVALVVIASFFTMHSVLKTSNNSIDVLSIIESTFGFGSLLYGFSAVGDHGWTAPLVYGSILLGLIFIGFFVYRQLHLDNPFLQLRVFQSPEFSLSVVLSSVTNMAMMGIEMILPLYLQMIKGLSAFHSGLALLLGALITGVMSPVTGAAFDKYGAKRLATTGMFFLTAGTVPFLFITNETSTLYIVVLYAFRMFGISMVNMPVTTSGMNSLPFNLISHGTAVNNTIRQVFTSMGTAVLISVLTNVTNTLKPAHSLLAATPIAYKNQMSNATIMGYRAAFGVSVALCLITFTLSFFLKDKKRSVDLQPEVK